MNLAIVFVVLFRISYGLTLHFELDQLFHDSNDRNVEFYHAKNLGKSKLRKSDETVQKDPIFIIFKNDIRSENSKTSPAFSSRVLETPSNNIADKTSEMLHDNILEDTLETIADIGDVLNNRISEDSLNSRDFFQEHPARKPRTAIQDRTSVKIVAGNTGQNKGSSCSCESVATSFPNVPAVCIFVKTFIKTVQSSELLTILFNIPEATPRQFSQYKYRFITDFFRKRGYYNANVIATFVVRPISKYFDSLLPQALMKVYSNYIANFLLAEEILTTDNAEELAMIYYRKLIESAKIHEITCESGYTSKFQAITDGETNFLLSFGELSYSKSCELCFYYAHEWLLAAVDYGTLRNLTM